MVERLLKDDGWSLKAEVCPVVPPHLLLSAFPLVPCPFQLSASSDLCFLFSVFCFLLFLTPLSPFRFENQQFQSPEARESVVKSDQSQSGALSKGGQIRVRPEVG